MIFKVRNRCFLIPSIFLFCTLLLLSLSFYSCDNFLSGSSIREQMESAITYANAPAYKVRVSADSGTGIINAGSGDNEMKVSDKITISFSKDKAYKFLKWQAVRKDDNSTSMAEYVKFADEKALETTAELIKAPVVDILIKPLCEEALAVTAKYPVASSEGVERDSTIKFVFSAPVSKNNDFSKIKISISGSAVDGRYNFQTPSVENNQLIIMAKTENRIEVPEGTTKTVTVTIPADIKYISNSGEIEIGEEITHTYTINSSTCNKAFITFGTSEEDSGSIKVNGMAASAVSQKFSIGESVAITFKLADGYRFIKWNCTDEGAFLFQYPTSDEYDEKGFNAQNSTVLMNLLIINQADANLIAEVEKIPTSKIKISSQNGKISPNGEYKYKEGDKISINFYTDSEYQFIKWKAYNGNQELSDEYIKFEKPEDSETSFTLIKSLGEDVLLTIVPECEERPSVLTSSPQYSTTGVYRDTRIKIIFTQSMSEESIYYSQDEFDEINKENKYEALSSDGKIYGYYKTDEKSSYVFKNITIRNRETGENLLSCYKMPYFESSDHKVLIIPAKNSVTDAPPSITDIEYALSNDYHTNEKIYLSRKYSNCYMTAADVDTDAPTMNLNDFTVELTSVASGTSKTLDYILVDNDKEYIGTKSDDNLYTGSVINIQKLHHKNGNKSISIKGSVSDNGSKPASFVVTLNSVESQYYSLKNKELYKKSINILPNAQGQVDFKTNGYTYDFSNYIVEDGVYDLVLNCYDNNDNKSELKYRFVYDNTAHQPTKICSGGKDKAVEVMCNLKEDIAELKIYNNSNSLQKTVTSPSTYVREKFTGKTNGYSYSYKFKTTDIVGNESEYTTSITEKAGVEIGQIVYLPENDYEERFASFNVYTEQNPIGVICNKTDLKTVRVYGLTEVDGFAWGGIARPSSGDYDWAHNQYGTSIHNNGLSVYKLFSGSFVDGGAYSFPETVDFNGKSVPVIWYYLYYTVNNQNRNPIIWYIPDYSSPTWVHQNYNTIDKSMKALAANGISATIGDTSKSYWTCKPIGQSNRSGYERANAYRISAEVDNRNDPFKNDNGYSTHFMCQVDLQ